MFRKGLLGLLGVGSFMVAMAFAETAHAECWYFSYNYNGQGPLHLGPYPSRNEAVRVIYDMYYSALGAGHRFQYVPNSLKDRCPSPPSPPPRPPQPQPRLQPPGGGYRVSAWAGPNVFGPWKTVKTHSGAAGVRIDAKPLGKTVVVGEIQYWKNANDRSKTVQPFYGSTTIRTAHVYGSVEVRFKGIPLGSAVEVNVH